MGYVLQEINFKIKEGLNHDEVFAKQLRLHLELTMAYRDYNNNFGSQLRGKVNRCLERSENHFNECFEIKKVFSNGDEEIIKFDTNE